MSEMTESKRPRIEAITFISIIDIVRIVNVEVKINRECPPDLWKGTLKRFHVFLFTEKRVTSKSYDFRSPSFTNKN